MKEKIKNILVKVKNNKKKVIGITVGVFLTFIFIFTVYNLNNPTKLNRLLASIGSTPNEAFEDSDFYNCIVDEYNNENSTSKAYTDSLTDEELASITSLTCNYKSIESAKGVEKLTGLTYLSLESNQLSSIDLSKNIALTVLNLGDNMLTNINLYNNTNLDDLALYRNQLTTVDLSNNKALTDLSLQKNQLTSVDLSNNSLLTDLNIEENQLRNINLNDNTALTSIELYGNQLTNIDLSSNISLLDLNIEENQLTSINLNNNNLLETLGLSDNKLTSINLNNNTKLTHLDLGYNQLVSIDLSRNVALTDLSLYNTQLTNIDLSNNEVLTELDLTDNKITNLDLSNNKVLTYLSLDGTQLTSLDLSNNTKLRSLYIEDTPLIEDILIQNGDVYTVEEKIIPPSGQSFSYSIGDTSIANIDGNTITALQEGSTTLRTNFGNVSFKRKIVVGEVKLSTTEDNIIINDEENYIYFKSFDKFIIADSENLNDSLRTNIGKVVIDGDLIKVVVGDKTYLEYKMVYFDGGTNYDDNGDYSVVVSSTEEPTKYNIENVNCTYEFTNDGKEVIIKYNGNEIDRKKTVYMYLPKDYKISGFLLYFGNNTLDSSIINNIDDVSQIDKNKINVLNAKMTFNTEEGKWATFVIESGNEEISDYEFFYVNSNNYDLTKNYVYLSTNEFDNDIQIFDSNHKKYSKMRVNINGDSIQFSEEGIPFYNLDLIKVSLDSYAISGDNIDLNGEDIDLSKINATNANLKVDNNKLLVMYNDEVVKEFKLENGKKEDTTTKPNEDKTTTTTKENKTTTTKKTTTKKKSIIDRIFGKSETTTKKEETTTKKTNILRRTNKTTKIESNSGSVTNDNKNSNNKIVTKSNILILLLGITGIGLIIYIIINKKKESN